MKKILFTVLVTIMLTACGQAYNSSLKQIELNMSKEQVVALMGDKYTSSGTETSGGKEYETIEYKDRYKFHWFFQFADGSLVKWWKEKE